MEKLLLEIGTEEIPAGYIQPALAAFSAKLIQYLDDARISHGGSKTYATPRRLTVMVENVAEKQEAATKIQTGPPEKVAFDADGNPTVAARKFAEKVGRNVADLRIIETPKGRYLSAEITEESLFTDALLKTILPEVISKIPFPKTMRWADYKIAFARPIRSILALLGSKAISFNLGGAIVSDGYTFGHRFMHPDKIKIEHADHYIEKLREASVLVDIDERKAAVQKEIAKAAAVLGGEILPDDELVDIVTNLVEIPFASAGRFDAEFLDVPREILITAMREHQKYFAVIHSESRQLLPAFIAINNTRPRDMQLVTVGHERVLRARLSDAKFFYQSDVKIKMDVWVEKLNGILFQAKLGSMHAKMERLRRLVRFISEKVAPKWIQNADRAAYLCKADLVSQVVGEFAKLQGIMGRVYAAVANEPGDVALAVEEHYRPVYSGAKLPETPTGALLAIADKMDSICGCFAVGLIPTGASDPYALRRQSIGILQIIQAQGWSLSLTDIITKSLSLYDNLKDPADADITQQIYAFFVNRIAFILAEQGFSKDVIAAVVSVGADNVIDVHRRVAALQDLKGKPGFDPLAIAFKRVINIIKKANQEDFEAVEPDIDRFLHASEKSLFKAYKSVKERADQLTETGRIEEALAAIASLKPSVDAFFEAVLVMDPDPTIRRNRLALLCTVAGVFEKVADFSKIST
jgi:glycyl-tRNA synthetase beta chain